eukprot:536901-Lingulodinium_polyedra.AAC.1
MASPAGNAQHAAAGTEPYVETSMDDAEENTNDVHHCTRHGNLDPVAIPVGDTSDDEGQDQGGPPPTAVWHCA